MAVYAVDFDGTLAKTRFPIIIAPNKKMVAFVKAVQAMGHKVILWTCRADEDLNNAVEWCRKQGIMRIMIQAAELLTAARCRKEQKNTPGAEGYLMGYYFEYGGNSDILEIVPDSEGSIRLRRVLEIGYFIERLEEIKKKIAGEDNKEE